jgi:hypothetical protein
LQRFEEALKAVLRRVDFFPLPHALLAECEALRKSSWIAKPSDHIWECEVCATRQASQTAERCHFCGASHLDMRRLTPEAITNMEMKRYHERIKSHPEEFVRVKEIFRTAYENAARRKWEAA